MGHIQAQSRRIKWLFQGLAILFPVGICAYWLSQGTDYSWLSVFTIAPFQIPVDQYTSIPLSAQTKLLAVICSLMLYGILFYAFKQLIQLFSHYEQGEIFTQANTRIYRKLGLTIFYWVIGEIIYNALMSIILTINNPIGERIFSIGISSMNLLTIILGFTVTIIAWVMQEAQQIAEENKYTI
ncbi:membrane protein [Shewanella sp. NFH-SH190041]|uniref:DUF2975 domain-containing protein n=1 Tax=Shewanella sp. NFH-SH190041 TaxID=2950245 RepID=UPI0021C459A3|nr:DUF2975 domain-containing protein [Shewanella sp. NFH-SH190041]BDM62917.1 membrane protein [Shewanella sp. NFH-SH190041]